MASSNNYHILVKAILDESNLQGQINKAASKIKNVNYTVTINGVAFTNQTRTTTKFCESGDSGGIVYIKQNSKNLPIGIIKGKNNLYSYYTKAIEVERLMKVYPY